MNIVFMFNKLNKTFLAVLTCLSKGEDFLAIKLFIFRLTTYEESVAAKMVKLSMFLFHVW